MIAATAQVVCVEGPDATALLDSQCSQALGDVIVGASTECLLLEPDGRLGFWLLVSREGEDRWALLAAEGSSSKVVERLGRFRLRERCTIGTAERWHAVEPGPSAGSAWSELLVEDLPAAAERVDPSAIEDLRVRAGRLGRSDLRQGDNPFSLGAEAVRRSTSFSKGCYTGQELVARMDARGASAPSRLAAISSGAALEEGMDLCVDGEQVGTVRTVAEAGDATRAIAMIKRSVLLDGGHGLTACGSDLAIALEQGPG